MEAQNLGVGALPLLVRGPYRPLITGARCCGRKPALRSFAANTKSDAGQTHAMRDKADLSRAILKGSLPCRPLLSRLLVLYDHRQKVFVTCYNCMVTLPVLVFHMPNVAWPNIPEVAIARGHSYRARKTNELLSDRSRMNWFIPTFLEPQKHGLRNRLGL